MSELVEIKHLTKRFGALTAVDDVSFSVDRGAVLGFLGPNGAGKSTTMKMITGFLTPDAGTDPDRRRKRGEQASGDEAPDRLPARGRATVRRHDTAVVPVVHRRGARHPRLRIAPAPCAARWNGCRSTRSPTARSRRCRRATSAGSVSRRRSSTTRRCWCSTSRPTASTRTRSWRCAR